MSVTAEKALRADSERTVQLILEAAERVLSKNPAATMEQIAIAAGVARTTVHRRFATRELLIDALTQWAVRQFLDAVSEARPETAPPLVALYQVTVNVLRVKINWSFAMNAPVSEDSAMAKAHKEILHCCDMLFTRARDAGVMKPDTDLVWARQAYYGLIHAATQPSGDFQEVDSGNEVLQDIDARATVVVDTLLRGIGTRDMTHFAAANG
jgi:AcrR family transcriptional regulator